MTWDDAMLLWDTWAFHRLHQVGTGVLLMLLVLDWFGAMMKVGVLMGTLIAGLHVSIVWGVWRGLRWLVRWLGRAIFSGLTHMKRSHL